MNKRTMMVLYRSPEQTDLHTFYVEVSAKFTALRFMYKFYNHDESWQLEQTW